MFRSPVVHHARRSVMHGCFSPCRWIEHIQRYLNKPTEFHRFSTYLIVAERTQHSVTLRRKTRRRRRKWKHGHGGGGPMKLYENFGSKLRILAIKFGNLLVVYDLPAMSCVIRCTFIRFSRSLHKHIYFSMFFSSFVSFRFIRIHWSFLSLSTIFETISFTFISFVRW